MRKDIDNERNSFLMETVSQEEPETVKRAWMKSLSSADLDWEKILPVFLDLTEENEQEYRFMETERSYEVGLRDMDFGDISGALYTIYTDDREYAGTSYISVISWSSLGDYFLMEKQWRTWYPDENLEVCTKEEAIEACSAYMDCLGYQEAEITAYAITLDAIEDANRRRYPLSEVSAPYPEYDRPSRKAVRALKDEGKTTEEAYEILGFEWNPELSLAVAYGIPWEKKHEAMMLVYRPYINGTLIASENIGAMVIYVPYYERPVYIEAVIPPVVDEILEEAEVISREKALEELMLNNWVKSYNDIEIKEMYLTSSIVMAEDPEMQNGGKRYQMRPSWKITFCLKDRTQEITQSVLIDALRGNIIE